jgi:hypothetical protein
MKELRCVFAMFFILAPYFAEVIIISLRSPNAAPSETPLGADLFVGAIYFIFCAIVFLILSYVHKVIGGFILLIPILIGVLMFIENSKHELVGDFEFAFLVFQLPVFLTTIIYSIGFFIKDILIQRKIIGKS